MKKSVFLLLIVTAFMLTSCSNEKKYSRYSMERLEEKKSELLMEKNNLICRSFIKYSKENNEGMPIYGSKELTEMINNTPLLQEYRQIFEKESDERWEFVESIKSWQEYEKAWYKEGKSTPELEEWRRSIIDSLRNSEGPYNKYMQDLQDSLRVSNRKILDHILITYEEQGKLFPIDWIPEKTMDKLLDYPEVAEILDEIRKVEEAIEEKEIES